MKSKRNSLLVLAFFFLSFFAGFGAQPAAAATNLTDITDNWAYKEITYLVDQGVVYGYADGTFKPNNSISRAEFIAMINRAFDFTATATISYTDVNRADWFYNEIAKAKAAGYITGFSDGSMKPNNLISRQEAAAIMARVMVLDISSSGSLPFSDAATIPSWSRNSIAAMVAAGYISGYPDGSFRPLNSISRSEAAVIIYKTMRDRVPVTGVTLNKSSATLYVGDDLILVANVVPNDANNPKVTWTSSDEDVATVSSTGRVTAVSKGTATIKVSTVDGSFEDTCRITVKPNIEVTGVSLEEASIRIIIGDDFTLHATIEPYDATNQDLIWTSDGENIATVDNAGIVTGVDIGDTIITVSTVDGDYTDTCRVYVDQPVAVAGVSLNKNTLTLVKGNSETLKATVAPSDATNQDVIWTSSDSNVATVSSSGLVTALETGSTTIKVRTIDGGFTDTCVVTVTP